MGGWVQIGPNQDGHGGRVRESRKLFDEVMAPNLLEQEEFLRSVSEPHEAFGPNNLARIESTKKGFKRLPLDGHWESPGHAAVAGVQMRDGRRLSVISPAIRHINARLGGRQAEKIADVRQTEREPDALGAGILFGNDRVQRIQ
jgi:hypothetical protein